MTISSTLTLSPHSSISFWPISMTSSKSEYYSIQGLIIFITFDWILGQTDDWWFSLVLKCDAIDLWKKRWRSKIPQIISTKNNHPSLLVELSIGNISQRTNVIEGMSPTWNQSFPLWVWSFRIQFVKLQLRVPRLSSKSSSKLSIKIHHDIGTPNSIVIGYGDITLDELLDGDGGKEGIDRIQHIIYA